MKSYTQRSCELAKMEREAAAKTAEVSRLGDSVHKGNLYNPTKAGFFGKDKGNRRFSYYK